MIFEVCSNYFISSKLHTQNGLIYHEVFFCISSTKNNFQFFNLYCNPSDLYFHLFKNKFTQTTCIIDIQLYFCCVQIVKRQFKFFNYLKFLNKCLYNSCSLNLKNITNTLLIHTSWQFKERTLQFTFFMQNYI